MKVIDIVIDAFWVVVAIWMVLFLWVWTDIPCPLFIKDILYAMSDGMDYWFYLNGILGTVRFVRRLRHQ